jgi:hypothetical protein
LAYAQKIRFEGAWPDTSSWGPHPKSRKIHVPPTDARVHMHEGAFDHNTEIEIIIYTRGASEVTEFHIGISPLLRGGEAKYGNADLIASQPSSQDISWCFPLLPPLYLTPDLGDGFVREAARAYRDGIDAERGSGLCPGNSVHPGHGSGASHAERYRRTLKVLQNTSTITRWEHPRRISCNGKRDSRQCLSPFCRC